MSSRLTILLVDDDPAHRDMLHTLLDDWGYGVEEAGDGEEAVAQCRERPFDLVLMDLRMPKKNGLEALVEIKAFNPAIPVLMMTAFSDVEAAVTAIKSGAYDYVTKPLDFEKLKVSLRNVFEYTILRQEHDTLLDTLASPQETFGIIGHSEPMRQMLSMVRTIAPSDATVLVCGESGTGKELIAKAIHTGSGRKKGPYVAFNCAAITESLMESELFGHEKGAFTGADKRREGRFAQADKGTLFLDEIGEMPLLMQAKLLRVIQEREVQPVGSDRTVHVDVRLVAATNRDLAVEVAGGRFREDLYYRLNVVSLALPPLRDRPDDIPLLAQYFLAAYAEKNGKPVKGFSPGAMDRLIRYAWPGNVRELENVIERAVVLLLGDHVTERELPPQLHAVPEAPYVEGVGSATTPGVTDDPGTLRDVERTAILQTLALTGGNKSEAAKRLGITRKTLHAKLQQYGEE